MTEHKTGFDGARLTQLACDLVRIPSVLGNEKNVADFVARTMKDLLFDRVDIDEAGNAVGFVAGKRPGPTLLYDAHMDTVDVVPREAWKHDPFGGQVENGRIYGRGSSDMKGALAAMIYAASQLDRNAICGRLVISASVGEELIEGEALAVVIQRVQPQYVVIGESSELNLVRAGRGRAELVLQTRGKPAHASVPHRGINAVHKMMRVLREIEKLPMPRHPFVGDGVMCLTDVISIPYPAHSVVPSGCRATYERRLIPGETREAVIAQIQTACDRANAGETSIELALTNYATYTGIRWEQPKWFAPWELEEEHELVQKALSGLRAAGLAPQCSSYQFCTNAAYSAGRIGLPTVGFGPSTEHLAHVVDEYLETDQLVKACLGYAAMARALLC